MTPGGIDFAWFAVTIKERIICYDHIIQLAPVVLRQTVPFPGSLRDQLVYGLTGVSIARGTASGRRAHGPPVQSSPQGGSGIPEHCKEFAQDLQDVEGEEKS